LENLSQVNFAIQANRIAKPGLVSLTSEWSQYNHTFCFISFSFRYRTNATVLLPARNVVQAASVRPWKTYGCHWR